MSRYHNPETIVFLATILFIKNISAPVCLHNPLGHLFDLKLVPVHDYGWDAFIRSAELDAKINYEITRRSLKTTVAAMV